MSQIKFYRTNISTYIALKYNSIAVGCCSPMAIMMHAGLVPAVTIKILLPRNATMTVPGRGTGREATLGMPACLCKIRCNNLLLLYCMMLSASPC